MKHIKKVLFAHIYCRITTFAMENPSGPVFGIWNIPSCLMRLIVEYWQRKT